jgi:hypothetical protein
MQRIVASVCVLVVTAGMVQGDRYQGFVGPYHPSNLTLPDGSGRGVWPTFRFGRTAIENAAEDGGWLLEDDLHYHCQDHDLNSVLGIMLPPTEKGVVSNPNDTSLWKPAATKPGLVQGAHRFSELSKLCPQLSGVIIDDFLQNYAGNETGCVQCPKSRPYMYGDKSSGNYCCPWPIVAGHCAPPVPLTSTAECCLNPGYLLKCQGIPRCGTNPQNHTGCVNSKIVTLEDVIQIKGALLGKSIDAEGRVDLSSPSTTPHLRLFGVWYTRFTKNYIDDGLLSGALPFQSGAPIPILDGISLWIEGTDQNAQYKQWTAQYHAFRAATDSVRTSHHPFPRLATYGGSYIEHSRIGILPPAPFQSMFMQSLVLYDEVEIEGFFLFTAATIPKLNHSMWEKWDLVHLMDSSYQPWLGRACGSVAGPLDTRVNVYYGTGAKEGVLVTSKFPRHGELCFDGWTGKQRPVAHRVMIPGTNRSVEVFLKAGETVAFKI